MKDKVSVVYIQMWKVGYVRNENEEIKKFNSYLWLKKIRCWQKWKLCCNFCLVYVKKGKIFRFLPFSQVTTTLSTDTDRHKFYNRKTDVIHPTVNKSKHIIIEPAASLTSSQPSLSLYFSDFAVTVGCLYYVQCTFLSVR